MRLTTGTFSKRLFATAALAAMSVAALLTTGCGLGTTLAPSMDNSPVTGAGISGSAHGGQQPITGAAVQLWTAGTSGYGSAGSALISSTVTTSDASAVNITAWAVAGGVATFTAANTYAVGNTVVLNNFGTTTAFNTQNVTITAATAATFTGTVAGVPDSTAVETGSADISSDTNANAGNAFNSLGLGGFTITSDYICPTAGTLVYLTVAGGNPGLSGTNSAIKLVAALGPCGGLASIPFVNVNEVSTAAAAFALGQYFTPAIGGASSADTFGSPNTAQAQIAIANAFATVSNLSNYATGGAVATNTYTGTASSVSGVTVTATPESAKLNTIADILSDCVNSAGPSSTPCAALFGAVVTTSGAIPADILQAAVYMSLNPTSTNSTASATNLATLYGLQTGVGSAGFSGLSAQPTDWTIGIAFTASGNCAGGGTFINGPYWTAIDASGNIWVNNAATSGANIIEMSPTGVPMVCFGNSNNGKGLTIDTSGNVWGAFNVAANIATDIQEFPAGSSTPTAWPVTGATPYNMVADGNGNVFYTTVTTGGGLAEFLNPGTTTTPFAPYILFANNLITAVTNNGSGIAVDASERVWETFSSNTDVAGFYPVTSPAIVLASYTVASNVATFTNTGTNTLAAGNFVTFADGSPLNGQSLAVVSSPAPTSTTFSVTYNNGSVAVGTTADTGTATPAPTYTFSVFAPKGPSYGMAADSSGNLFTGETCCGTTTDRSAEKFTPGVSAATTTTPALSAQDAGGLNGSRAVALDGASNVWFVEEYNGTGTAITNGLGAVIELTSSLAAISPGGYPGSTLCNTTVGCPAGGFIHSGAGYGGQGGDIAIDPSGNVWAPNNGLQSSANTGTDIEEIVGAAVPVVTPIAVGIKTGKLASRP